MGGGETRVPSEVHDLTGVSGIAAGASHSLALRSSGRINAWGDNSKGQLGHAGPSSSRVPIDTDDIEDATFIAAGPFQSFAVQSGGSLWAWGSNADHRLGVGRDEPTFAKPARVVDARDILAVASAERVTFAVNSIGAVFSWGKNNPVPEPSPGASPRVQLSSGWSHTLLR